MAWGRYSKVMHIVRGALIQGPGGIIYGTLHIRLNDGTKWDSMDRVWTEPVWCREGIMAIGELIPDGFGRAGQGARLWVINVRTGAMSEVDKTDRGDLVPIEWTMRGLRYEYVRHSGRIERVQWLEL